MFYLIKLINYISVVKENYLITPIDYLKGVGPNRADLLRSELKINTFNDLLYFFPFRYIDKTKFYINGFESWVMINC